MKNLMILLFSTACLFAMACNGSKKSTTKKTEVATKMEKEAMVTVPDMTIRIKKGQCFGRCPVFEFSIDSDGSATYYGRRFVDNLGRYKGQVEPSMYQKIASLCLAAGLQDLEDTYRSGATDLPTHTLIVTDKNGEKSVRGDHSLPKSVKLIIQEMDSLSKTIAWTMTEANVPRDIVLGEILVDAVPGADFDKIVADFSDYGLKMGRKIAPNMNMYVLKFNPEIEKPGVLVAKLMELPEINTAQFNQKVKPREH